MHCKIRHFAQAEIQYSTDLFNRIGQRQPLKRFSGQTSRLVSAVRERPFSPHYGQAILSQIVSRPLSEYR